MERLRNGSEDTNQTSRCCSRIRKLIVVLIAAVASAALSPSPSRAQNEDLSAYKFDTYVKWLNQYRNAQADFKPGDVLTAKDLDRLRPFMPPGFISELNFPEFRMPIIAPRDNTPRRDYVDCSEKYQGQVKLNPDGSMSNYVCGQPFSNASLSESDPMAGLKAAWNYNYRWQNYGITKCACVVTWSRFPGQHNGYNPAYENPPADFVQGVGGFVFEHPDSQEVPLAYGGGGSFERTLLMSYAKLYYTHVAALSDKGATLPVPGASQLEYKEYVGFFSPFDIRGTAFLTYRYSDPHRADDAWAYLPALRRVRRISVEVKSDALLGTDHTLEDFYSFSGRPLEWNWKFLGFKDVVSVMNSKQDFQHVYGPKGIVPNDQWQLRRFAVVQRVPKNPLHVYSSIINFWDTQNWDAFYEVGFDRSGKLWKLWFYPKMWTEDYQHPWLKETNKGTYTTDFQGVQVEDVQNNRATLWPCYCGHPVPDLKILPNFLNSSTLEAAHR